MRARRLLPLLLVLATVAVGATGCFESELASTTISGEITVGQGTTAQTVDVAAGEGSGGTTAETTTAETTTAETTTGEETTGETSTGEETTGETSRRRARRRPAAAPRVPMWPRARRRSSRPAAPATRLKDAGTSGNVGPDLDSLAPLSEETVAKQIENGGGAMPAKLLTGQDAANVAAYVASVAGK